MNMSAEQAAKVVSLMEAASEYVRELTTEQQAEIARRVQGFDITYEQAETAVNELALTIKRGQRLPKAADFLAELRRVELSETRPASPVDSDPALFAELAALHEGFTARGPTESMREELRAAGVTLGRLRAMCAACKAECSERVPATDDNPFAKRLPPDERFVTRWDVPAASAWISRWVEGLAT